MVNSGQDIKTRVITLSYQEVVIAIMVTSVMREISSMPGVMDALQTKPTIFQHSVRT
jgi:hypothetical protein